MTDVSALLVIVGMAMFGWRRGTVSMALWAGGLVGGYAAALLLFRPVGSLLAGASGLPQIAAYPLAGMIVLIGVSSAVSWYARRLRRERATKMAGGWEPPAWDAKGGMVLGAAYGGALALIVTWAVAGLGGLYAHRDVDGIRSSMTGRASAAVTEQALSIGTRAMVGDPFVARSMAHVVADPAAATESLNVLMADVRLQQLLQSGALRQAAASEDPTALARDPSLVALAGDEAFVSVLRDFGVLQGGSGPATPAEVSEAITREAGPVLRSVEVLKNDPEIRSILSNPSFRDALEEGEYLSLAQDERFTRLFERVLEELRRHR